jgi:hypothetical protein
LPVDCFSFVAKADYLQSLIRSCEFDLSHYEAFLCQ